MSTMWLCVVCMECMHGIMVRCDVVLMYMGSMYVWTSGMYRCEIPIWSTHGNVYRKKGVALDSHSHPLGEPPKEFTSLGSSRKRISDGPKKEKNHWPWRPAMVPNEFHRLGTMQRLRLSLSNECNGYAMVMQCLSYLVTQAMPSSRNSRTQHPLVNLARCP